MSGEPEICPCCDQLKTTVARRSMSTEYVKEESNYETTCLECHEDHEDYWQEMWREYNAGRI